MARMSNNDECPSGNFIDSSQLTNLILDSGETYHLTPEVSDFIPGSLEDTDKHIEVADGHPVTEKQKGQVQIKICNDHREPFYCNVTQRTFSPDLCDILFSIVTLMNLGHTCLFQIGFCTV